MVTQGALGRDPQQIKTAGDVATLARAVRHAADIPGVRVINISLIDCIPVYKQVDQAALGAALRYAAIDKDIVVVAAAGNTGESNCGSNPLTDPNKPDDPRNWAAATTISTPSYWQPYVLSVASLTPEGQPSNFTMAGPWVGIAGPGEQIVSLGNAPNSGLVNGQPSSKEPLVPSTGPASPRPTSPVSRPWCAPNPRPDRPSDRQPAGLLGAQRCAFALESGGRRGDRPRGRADVGHPRRRCGAGPDASRACRAAGTATTGQPAAPHDRHCQLEVVWTFLVNRISLIRHTRPGESRRRTGENRPRTAQVDSAVVAPLTESY